MKIAHFIYRHIKTYPTTKNLKYYFSVGFLISIILGVQTLTGLFLSWFHILYAKRIGKNYFFRKQVKKKDPRKFYIKSLVIIFWVWTLLLLIIVALKIVFCIYLYFFSDPSLGNKILIFSVHVLFYSWLALNFFATLVTIFYETKKLTNFKSIFISWDHYDKILLEPGHYLFWLIIEHYEWLEAPYNKATGKNKQKIRKLISFLNYISMVIYALWILPSAMWLSLLYFLVYRIGSDVSSSFLKNLWSFLVHWQEWFIIYGDEAYPNQNSITTKQLKYNFILALVFSFTILLILFYILWSSSIFIVWTRNPSLRLIFCNQKRNFCSEFSVLKVRGITGKHPAFLCKKNKVLVVWTHAPSKKYKQNKLVSSVDLYGDPKKKQFYTVRKPSDAVLESSKVEPNNLYRNRARNFIKKIDPEFRFCNNSSKNKKIK